MSLKWNGIAPSKAGMFYTPDSIFRIVFVNRRVGVRAQYSFSQLLLTLTLQALADVDDGSCLTAYGCMDPLALIPVVDS